MRSGHVLSCIRRAERCGHYPQWGHGAVGTPWNDQGLVRQVRHNLELGDNPIVALRHCYICYWYIYIIYIYNIYWLYYLVDFAVLGSVIDRPVVWSDPSPTPSSQDNYKLILCRLNRLLGLVNLPPPPQKRKQSPHPPPKKRITRLTKCFTTAMVKTLHIGHDHPSHNGIHYVGHCKSLLTVVWTSCNMALYHAITWYNMI